MQKLFSPWRSQYINSFIKKKKSTCIFCNALESKNDSKKLILHRGKYCFVIMNLFPYNNGHLMIVPNNHIGEMKKLDDKCALEMHKLVSTCIDALTSKMKPQGFNVGMNLGKVAGAGVEEHLHIHIVPRWNGDTNFMPVLADVKMISEDLKTTYSKLKKYFKKGK